MARTPDTIAPADRAAFHRHIGEINRRRIRTLGLATVALLGLAAALNVLGGARLTDSGVLQNLGGVALALLVLATARWSRRPGLSALIWGYAVLGWGDTVIAMYVTEISLGHASHASQQFVIYFITRYLAAMSVVWRPRDLAIALALNHFVAMWPMLPRGFAEALLYPGIWTSTAWLVAYVIYRAERDAFVARLGLQRQRDALSKANAHLEQLNQEKTDLMAIAAHDLRSPLMGMTMLLNVTADEAGRRWQGGVSSLRALEQSCKDMADLVTRVLDVHKAADAVGQLQLESTDVRAAVVKAVAAHQPRARAKGIDVAVDSGTTALPAMHDPQALERVLDNLLSNAVKFSPPDGQVRVRVWQDGAAAAIAISDSGPGISDADRPLLFRKFARLRPRPTAGESSSGLGLYITKQLVDAMGGTIVVSGAGTGATFTVSLPLASA